MGRDGGCFATIKVKKNPRTVLEHGSGISFFVHMELLHLFLPNRIIAYAGTFFNMLSLKILSLFEVPRHSPTTFIAIY